MESAGLRDRSRSLQGEFDIPRYTVDLSKPPDQRYNHIVADFKDQINALPSIFDDLIGSIFPPSLVQYVKFLAKLFLRGVYDNEEYAELKGVSKQTGIEMFLLVAFNVLLDCLMGCTSGGVRVQDRGSESKLLHFRALDWGMDELRKVTCQIDFVRKPGGPVVARSITYAGYVGVLTGVRKDLSISLNFRPHHDTSSWLRRVRYVCHCLLVLLGFRRSISSLLRQFLLSPGNAPQISDVVAKVEPLPSTAAYLIFCSSEEAVSIEMDNRSARADYSKDFIVTMNHDLADEKAPENLGKAEESLAAGGVTGMSDLVEGSIERKQCTKKLWDKVVRRWEKKRSSDGPSITTKKLVEWMEKEDIVNDQTHYATIMDPKEGEIIWSQRWLEPNYADGG